MTGSFLTHVKLKASIRWLSPRTCVWLPLLLLAGVSDPSCRQRHRAEDLVAAARRGDLVSVQRLAEAGVNIDKKVDWRTAAHACAENGHLDVLEYLAEQGANLMPSGEYGEMPIHLAARNGHVAVVKLLLSKGIDVNIKGGCLTPLHYAAESGQLEMTRFLTTKGADLNACCQCYSPLQAAILNGRFQVAQFLLDAARFQAEARDVRERKPRDRDDQ